VSHTQNVVLTAVMYFRLLTRSKLSLLFAKEVSRDVIGQLRALKLREFLSHFGFDTLHDLPDIDAPEGTGLLSKQKVLAGAFPEGGSQGLFQ
jgi:segregation and condensation protein B